MEAWYSSLAKCMAKKKHPKQVCVRVSICVYYVYVWNLNHQGQMGSVYVAPWSRGRLLSHIGCFDVTCLQRCTFEFWKNRLQSCLAGHFRSQRQQWLSSESREDHWGKTRHAQRGGAAWRRRRRSRRRKKRRPSHSPSYPERTCTWNAPHLKLRHINIGLVINHGPHQGCKIPVLITHDSLSISL